MEKKKPFFNLLQFKIHLGIQFILVLCFFALGYFIYLSQLNFLISDIERQGTQQADMVAEASAVSIQRESYYLLEELATKAEYSPLVAYCQITDPSGKSFLQGEVRPGLTRDDLMRTYSPADVRVISRDVSADGRVVGQIKLGMFIDKAKQEVRNTTVQLVAVFTAMLGVIALFLYFFLNRLLILPVVNLAVLTETLSRGEFVTTHLDRRQDELGVLARGFNNMSRNLKELYRDLEKKVEARTEDLNNAYFELQAIFDNSLVGIAVLSADHRVVRSNARFASIFGYTVRELPLVSPEKFHASGQGFDEFSVRFYNRLAETEIVQLEYQFRRKNGEVFWSQVSAKAIDPQNLSRGIIFILEDISDRKKASELLRQHAEDLRVAKEEADRATRSKSEFLARMSHEIRTPMNAILGMAEMLQDTGLNEEQQEYVRTFSSAGEMLLGIINDILDFSKIEVGQIKLESIPFNLRNLVSDVTKLFVYRAGEKGLHLEQHVAPDIAQRYIGDPTRLRQVIINLLGNAMKFTSKGSVTLSVTGAAMDDGAPCCLFAVKDTGIGIPQDKLEAIFESFAQADSSTTREFGGTGLGLAISRKLVELMGGQIWAESELRAGTTFFIKVPLTPDMQAQQAEAQAILPADTKILVLEDQSENQGSIASLVRSWGIVPIFRKTAAQAAEVLSEHKPDAYHAIIIDALIDYEPGIDAVRLLVAKGLSLPGLILLVEDPGEFLEIQSQNITGLTCLLKGERNALLLEKTQEAIAGAQRRRMTDFEDKKWRILLVDDVEANRRVVELFLKSSNVSLEQAENGKIAIEKFVAEPFDLVLMDMEMPVMDGLEATRRIRAWERENRKYKTPIIALTAHAFQEHRQKTEEAGCTEFLPKPIKKQALISTIELFAGRRDSFDGVPTIAPAAPAAPSAAVPTAMPETMDDESPVQIDPELNELRPLFLRTVRESQCQMVEAIATGDFPLLQRLGHSLKGLGSTYGVDEISLAGKIIEAAARNREVAEIQDAMHYLAVFMSTGQAPDMESSSLFGDESVTSQATPEVPAPDDSLDEPVVIADKAPVIQDSGSMLTLEDQEIVEIEVGPILEIQELEDALVEVDAELFELVPLFMDTMRSNIAEMREALTEFNYDLICRHGHSQKGLGSTYGFDYLGHLGARIEAAGMQKSDVEVGALLDEMGSYLERVRIVKRED